MKTYSSPWQKPIVKETSVDGHNYRYDAVMLDIVEADGWYHLISHAADGRMIAAFKNENDAKRRLISELSKTNRAEEL